VCDCLIHIIDDCSCLIERSLFGDDGVNCGIVDQIRNEFCQDSLGDDYTRPVSLGIFNVGCCYRTGGCDCTSSALAILCFLITRADPLGTV
jgi:hypothetical protein